MEFTKVIFRKWPNGDIIALFPEELGNYSPYTCSSYEHIGQHGTADPFHVINSTKLAKPDEYANLKKELENYGPEDAHYHLQICKKHTYQMLEIRKQKLKEYISG